MFLNPPFIFFILSTHSKQTEVIFFDFGLEPMGGFGRVLPVCDWASVRYLWIEMDSAAADWLPGWTARIPIGCVGVD